MGSYAKLQATTGSEPSAVRSDSEGWFGTFGVKQHLLSFQDIYVPDGQLDGHVEPPLPIQQAFGQGWYKLRDANWDPHFPTSAKTIRWFLEKGKEVNPEVLVAINLSTIEKILEVTGPVNLDSLNLTLESKNISLILQNNIQENFFPGSTNKKDLISTAGDALKQKLSNLSLKQKLKITKLLYKDLKNGEILLNSTDQKLQSFLEKKDLAGELKPNSCNNCLQDTIAIIESNLGSNKANAHITRQTTHTILRGSTLEGVATAAGPLGQKAEGGSNPNESFITHQITINYTNTSPSENPDPPNHHGGDYINYLRLYIPTQATNIQAPPNFSSSPEHGFTKIGFFHSTPHQSTSSVTISYQLPFTNQKSYQLSILKQPGIANSPQNITFFGKTKEINLTKDYTSKTIKL